MDWAGFRDRLRCKVSLTSAQTEGLGSARHKQGENYTPADRLGESNRQVGWRSGVDLPVGVHKALFAGRAVDARHFR